MNLFVPSSPCLTVGIGPPRLPSRIRHLNRRLNRPLRRRLAGRIVRKVGHAPRVDYLARALSGFRRAGRARRRLARLAPEIFDDAVVQRLSLERADQERLHAELGAAMVKVYGPAADPSELHRSTDAARCENSAETVQFSPRQSLVIEDTLAQCELWMTEARQSFARYQKLQQHRRVSLGLAVSGGGELSLDGVRLRTEPPSLLAAGLTRHFRQGL